MNANTKLNTLSSCDKIISFYVTYLLLQVSRMIQALKARADPFKAACRASSSHQNKTETPEKHKWSTGDRSLVPNSGVTFLYSVVPLPLIIPSQLIMSAPALD